MGAALSLTGFRIPDDLTDDLLRDALCARGDVSSMSRDALLRLWNDAAGEAGRESLDLYRRELSQH